MSFARAKYSDYEFSYELGLMHVALSTHKPVLESTQNQNLKKKNLL
jgi:hypothetical protein